MSIRLSFVSTRTGREQIYRLDIREPDRIARLTRLPGFVLSPTWSPDGSRFAFQWLRRGDKSPGIYVAEVDGATPQLVVEHAGSPAWSPDGHTLAFANLREGRRGISLLDLEEAKAGELPEIRILTNVSDLVPEEWPWWSPDGQHILFTSQRSGNSDVWITDLDGDVRNLTQHPSLDGASSMSPDGEWIAFESNRDADSQEGGDIYLMRADGTGVSRLTSGQDNYNPVWSPDGRFIAFTSQRSGHAAVYLMRPDGTDQRRVTTGRHPAALPAWVGSCRVRPAA